MSTQTQSRRSYYLAINHYRSSTSEGFVNTWAIYRASAAEQRRILRDGLPVRDQWLLASDGTRSPIYSTMGVRRATRTEIRHAERQGHVPSANPGKGGMAYALC